MKEEIKYLFEQFTAPTLVITVALSIIINLLYAFSLLTAFNYFIYVGYAIASYLMLNACIKTINFNNRIAQLLSELNSVNLNQLNSSDIMKIRHNIIYAEDLQKHIMNLKSQIKLIIPAVIICMLLTTLIDLPKFNFGLHLELFSFSGAITLFNLDALFISFVISATLYLYSFKVEAKRIHKRLNKIYQQVKLNDK